MSIQQASDSTASAAPGKGFRSGLLTGVLMDASSAILLHKAAVLETLAAAFCVFVVPSVYREVVVPGRRGSAWFVHALTEERIRLLSPEGSPIQGVTGLGEGERDTLLAFGQGKARFIILDDGKGAKRCRAMSIPYVNALLCPKILFGSGWIDRQAYDTAFDFLLKVGRYSPFVADYARQCSARQLTIFYP